MVDIYDETNNTWTTTTLNEARETPAAATVGTKVFFAGGYNKNSQFSNVVDIYDTNTGAWTNSLLSSKRSSIAATSVGTTALFAGGDCACANGFSDVVDIYDDETKTWATSKLSAARSQMAAASSNNKAFFAGGTSNITSGESDVVDIYNFSCPAVNVIVNPSLTICAGDSIKFSASGATDYSWAPSSGLTSAIGSKTAGRPSTTTEYTLTTLKSGACRYTKTIDVTVKPLPTIVADNQTVCRGDSVLLTASGASSYTWSPSQGLSATSGGKIKASPSKTTNYTVAAVDANNCSTAKVVTVTLNELPAKPTITIGGQSNGSELLASSSASGNQWFKNNQPIQGATNQLLPVTTLEDNTYTVQVTQDNCLSPMSDRYIVTEINDLASTEIWLYPNPANRSVKIECQNFDVNQKIEVVAFDILGKIAMRTEAWVGASDLDISSFSPGIYVFKATQGNRIRSTKLIKY